MTVCQMQGVYSIAVFLVLRESNSQHFLYLPHSQHATFSTYPLQTRAEHGRIQMTRLESTLRLGALLSYFLPSTCGELMPD